MAKMYLANVGKLAPTTKTISFPPVMLQLTHHRE